MVYGSNLFFLPGPSDWSMPILFGDAMRLRGNKYGAKKATVDGYEFDSQLEARRYGELKLLEKSGEISRLEVHPDYPIHIRGVHVCDVELDFYYVSDETESSYTVNYEDCKGHDTPLSRLKRKLFEAQYRATVMLVRAAR